MPSYDLVDNALKGQLADTLARLQDEGWSLREIADYFRDEGFKVSYSTVRRWLIQVDA